MGKIKESLSRFTKKTINKGKEILNKKDDKGNSENNNQEIDNKVVDNNDNLEPKNEKKYSILSPIKDADISGYKEALDFVFLNDEIKNVAISGAYCSGKSSIIETYEEKDEKKRKFLHISLAHFCALCQSDKEKMIVGKDKATTESKILSHKLIKNDKNRATIESKIINQLIQQIPVGRIKQTNFRIKKNFVGAKACALSVILCVILALLLLVVKFHSWENYYNKELRNVFLKAVLEVFSKPEARFLCVVILLVIIGFIVFKLIYAQYTSGLIRKISFQGNEIEIGNDSNDSFFDKYLNEVIYIFDKVEADAIVFEDIDRFDDIALFEKLREINTLVNIRKSRKLLKKNRKPLRFLYMLRDDLFVEFKERTKFFDFIIPVIPVVDGSNSYSVIRAKLEKAGMYRVADDQYIKEISLYIDDYRILKNVINELFLYDERLNKELGDKQLDTIRLLAIIVYKNIFPKDYDELRFRRGCVYSFFAAEPVIREFIKSPLCEEENRINNEKESAKEERRTALAKLKKETELNDEDSQKPRHRDVELSRWEIIRKTDSAIRRLNDQIYDLHRKQAEIDSLSLGELLSGYSDKIFSQDFLTEYVKIPNEMVNHNYFGLIKYLLSAGHIDASYTKYTTYQYENGLSLNDNYFIRSVLEHNGLEYGYHIDSSKQVIKSINPKYFSHAATLNYDLYDYIFSEQDLSLQKQQAKLLFESSRRNEHIGFIEGYLLSGRDTSAFVKFLLETWEDVFDCAYDSIKEDALIRFSIIILNNCTDEKLNLVHHRNRKLTSFISSRSFIFSAGIDRNKLLSALRVLDAKIVDLQDENIGVEVLDYLYQNELYQINPSNILFLLKAKCEVEDVNSLMKTLLSFVFNSIDNYPFCKYVYNNLESVIPIYLEMFDGRIEDDPDTVCKVLNRVNNIVANKYIDQLITKIGNITDIKNPDILPLLIEHGLVEYSAENIINWYEHDGSITPALMSFVQSDDSIVIYDLEDDKTKGFLSELLKSDELSNDKFLQIVKSLGNRVFDILMSSHISENRMRDLIDLQVLECSKKSKDFIRMGYPNLLELFICKNIDNYFTARLSQQAKEDFCLALSSDMINVDKKIELLQKHSFPISLVDKQYPESVTLHILQHNFDINDLEWLARNYSIYSDSVKRIISSIIVNHPSIIIRMNKEMNHELKVIILSNQGIDFSQRVRFLSMYLDEIEEEELSELLFALGANKIAENINGLNNRLTVDQKNRSILRVLWKKHIIMYPRKTSAGKQYQKLQFITSSERPHVSSHKWP